MVRLSLILLPLFPVWLLADGPVRDFWFDGAEISRYELSQPLYGETHPGYVEFIFVTEPFLLEAQVKRESGSGESTDVLKLNALHTFNTGIYSYRTMTSTFKPIDLETFPHALKTNTSVQDWCGQVFQQINRQGLGWRVSRFSYFQDQADQQFELPDAFLEDELWVLIRLDPSRLPQGDFEAIQGALHLRLAQQRVQVSQARGKLEVGAEQSTYGLRYPDSERELRITFDTTFPHIIRRWTDSSPHGTTTATLQNRIMNSYYWLENTPADREKREKLGLEPVPK